MGLVQARLDSSGAVTRLRGEVGAFRIQKVKYSEKRPAWILALEFVRSRNIIHISMLWIPFRSSFLFCSLL